MIMNFISISFLFLSVIKQGFPEVFILWKAYYKQTHSLKTAGILAASETKYGSPSCSAPGLTHA